MIINCPELTNHRWKFQNVDEASRMFDILMLHELHESGNNYGIFEHFNIFVEGFTPDGKFREVQVKNMLIGAENKAIIITTKDDQHYALNLDKSIAQFVRRFWEEK